jgi:hypothetical protein
MQESFVGENSDKECEENEERAEYFMIEIF